ncbi:MAG: hypothetical protein WCJ88_11615 [Actinomycetes bacterium]
MGKASQAKKAARLARESGQVEERPKRRLAFPLAVAGAIVVGVILVVLARQPASTPELTVDPTTVTVDPTSPSSDPTATTIASGAAETTATTVPTTTAPGQ